MDASFLHQETGASHMSVGGFATFAGPAPRIDELRERIRLRLHLIPRYRQRLACPAAGAGRPLWADDPHFDVAFHVRRATVAPPGGETELCELIAGIFAQRVDRARPLWEVWLIEGLASGRFGIISKHHHALNDGLSTVDVLHVMWDAPPGSDPPDRDDGWRPRRDPSQLELAGQAVVDLVEGSAGVLRSVVDAAGHPRGLARRLSRAAEGVGELVAALGTPAPPTPINVTIGPDRGFRFVRYDLADFKRVKSALGGTVNDVMLTVVAGGIVALFSERKLPRDQVALRAIVPVSIRREHERAALGNRVVTLRPAIPLEIDDPVERLAVVRDELDRLKRSTQPTVVEVLERLMDWVPPQALAPVARLAYHPRLFNLLVSNVPGPDFPLSLLGREAIDMYPIGFLAPRHALATAAVSYRGGLGFGLICEPKILPELDAVVAGMNDTLERLLSAARASAGTAAIEETA